MRWEYTAQEIISETPIFLCELLNDLGKDGWELIHCDLDRNIFIFKRSLGANIIQDTYDEAVEGYFGGKVG